MFSLLIRLMNSWRIVHLFICLPVMFFTLIMANEVRAEAKIVIKPGIETYGQYDSNFYRANDNERSVYTYHVKPGFVFGVDTPKSELLIKYDLDAQWYEDKHDVPVGQEDSDTYDFVGHQAELSASSQFTSHLLAGIDEFFIKTRDPGNSDIFNNIVERYKYSLNRLSPQLICQFTDRVGIGLKYTRLTTNYDKSLHEDSGENRGTVDFFYTPSKKTALGINYQVWARDYDIDTPDYDSSQVMLTAMHSGKYFSLTAGAGVHDREFDEPGVDDIDTFVWTISLIGQNPPEETDRPKSSLELSAGQNFNDNGLGHQYFKATRLEAAVSCLVFNKLNLFLSGTYQNSDYKTSDREDDIYRTSLEIDYFINDYLTLGLESGYEARDSNESGMDYHNRFALATIACRYNLGSR